MSTGIGLIELERIRQITQKGFSVQHDSHWEAGQMAKAAICYAMNQRDRIKFDAIDEIWPWSPDMFEPENRKWDLIRAGALIAAELDRILAEEAKRAAASS